MFILVLRLHTGQFTFWRNMFHWNECHVRFHTALRLWTCGAIWSGRQLKKSNCGDVLLTATPRARNSASTVIGKETAMNHDCSYIAAIISVGAIKICRLLILDLLLALTSTSIDIIKGRGFKTARLRHAVLYFLDFAGVAEISPSGVVPCSLPGRRPA